MKWQGYILIVTIICSGFFSCTKEIDYSFDGEKCTYFLPQAFTPNDDNLNEYYSLIVTSNYAGADEISEFKIEMKSGGKKIFTSDYPEFRWYGVDASGNPVTGEVKVTLTIGFNGETAKKINSKFHIVRDACVPRHMKDYLFGDMVDAHYGAIYRTQETFCP